MSNASELTPLLQGTEDLTIRRLLIVVDAIADLQAIITTLQSASMRFPMMERQPLKIINNSYSIIPMMPYYQPMNWQA